MTQPLKKAVFLDSATLKADASLLEPLKNLFDEWYNYPQTEPEQVINRLQDAQVAICNKVKITKEVIDACPNLQLILICATGTNNIDLIAAKERHITVCNCQAYGTSSVSQHTFTLILALATRLLDYTSAVNKGEWQRATSFCLMDYPVMEIAGKTLGIIGYGELGKTVAKLAQAFGMKVLIGQLPSRPHKEGALPLSTLLPQVDILTLHCPLTEETKNLITLTEMQTMKKQALLINTARGGIVNEEDLAKALKEGILAGAATDVLSTEPPTEGNPLLDPSIPNLIITPHSAWASKEAQNNILKQVTENIEAFIKGNPIRVII